MKNILRTKDTIHHGSLGISKRMKNAVSISIASGIEIDQK